MLLKLENTASHMPHERIFSGRHEWHLCRVSEHSLIILHTSHFRCLPSHVYGCQHSDSTYLPLGIIRWLPFFALFVSQYTCSAQLSSAAITAKNHYCAYTIGIRIWIKVKRMASRNKAFIYIQRRYNAIDDLCPNKLDKDPNLGSNEKCVPLETENR